MTYRDVAVGVSVAAPIDAVWAALRDPVEIRRWHGWELDRPDEEIEQIYRTEAVEEAATGPERRLMTGRARSTSGPQDRPLWSGWC